MKKILEALDADIANLQKLRSYLAARLPEDCALHPSSNTIALDRLIQLWPDDEKCARAAAIAFAQVVGDPKEWNVRNAADWEGFIRLPNEGTIFHVILHHAESIPTANPRNLAPLLAGSASKSEA